MKMEDLFGFIQRELAQAGFRLSDVVGSSRKCAYFVLGDELKKVPLSADYPCLVLSGYCVEAAIVPHANQAEADASYSLEITKWERSSGKRIDKVRLPNWRTEKTLRAYMAPLIAEYKKLIEEKELEKAVDELLDSKSAAV